MSSSLTARMEFVKCLGHPEEIYNLLRYQMGGRYKVIPKINQVSQASLAVRAVARRAPFGPGAKGPKLGARGAASGCQTPQTPSFPPGADPSPVSRPHLPSLVHFP